MFLYNQYHLFQLNILVFSNLYYFKMLFTFNTIILRFEHEVII